MTKHLLNLHRVDELKNFVADNLLNWCLKSCIGSAQLVSHVLGRRVSERETVTTKQIQLGIWVGVQL